jgi:predicted 2-oxoglutarate/Fe(II)-dependent dioxygenase YbiX
VRKEELGDDRVFVIHEFLTPQECARFMAASEVAGYGDAPLTTVFGPVLDKDVRDNARVMVDDPVLAAELWARAAPFIPQRLGPWQAVGFNERFRYYRYDAGQQFAPHFDGAFVRGPEEESKLTFMVYLNQGFTGGQTRFYDGWSADLRLSVEPECGKALVFVHRQLHEGAPVLAGRKYVLRTDVIYRRVPREGKSN